MSEKITCLIIDSDIPARMRLKQAAIPLGKFSNTSICSSFEETTQKLSGEYVADLIFISERFEEEVTTDFVRRAKDMKGGQDSAFVLVLGSQTDQSQRIARSVLTGFDGFLMEPFSVNDLEGVVKLTQRIKKERSSAREKRALELLLRDMIKQLDKIAFIASKGRDPKNALKKMHAMCATLEGMGPQAKEIYYECVVTAMENAPLNSFSADFKNYAGTSTRIKKALEDKMLAQMEQAE